MKPIASTASLLFLLLIVFAPCNAVAQDDSIPTGKKKEPFEIKQYKKFIDFDLSRPKPACSMKDMGIPGRRVEGQLVDADGAPLAGVVVAVVEPIGYSTHCYFDNFDTTDDQGRFLVAGSVGKTRLVFRKPDGKIWVAAAPSKNETIRVAWPASAAITLRFPKIAVEPGQVVTIRTKNYWSGMSVMRQSTEVSDSKEAVFEDVVPAEYYVTVRKDVDLPAGRQSSSIEVGEFLAKAGEKMTVDCQSAGTTLTGKYGIPVGNMFAVISRLPTSYVHQPPNGEMLKFDESGEFVSRPLSPGCYQVRLLAKGLAAPVTRFGGGDPTVKSWLVRIDGTQKNINLNTIPEPNADGDKVEGIVKSAASVRGRLRGEVYANRVKALEDPGGAIDVLLNMLRDESCLYRWRSVIPTILQEMTDRPQVVHGMLAAIADPINERERGAIIRSLQTATVETAAIVDAIGLFVEPAEPITDASHITRGITIRVLGELAVRNPDLSAAVTKLLQKGLEDPWESTRLTAADYLGRLVATDALPALLKASGDAHGPVAVNAALSAWKVSGNPDDVYPIMTEVLNREGLAGLWEAAYFMSEVAKKHPIPESTLGALRRVSTMAGKPPFRSTFEYEQSRAARAAETILQSVAAQSKD